MIAPFSGFSKLEKGHALIVKAAERTFYLACRCLIGKSRVVPEVKSPVSANSLHKRRLKTPRLDVKAAFYPSKVKLGRECQERVLIKKNASLVGGGLAKNQNSIETNAFIGGRPVSV